MKKFFAFVAAALVAFSFASCDSNNNPLKKDGFKITVSDITATTAVIAVEPADTVSPYYWNVFDAESIAEFKTDEELLAAVLEDIDAMIEMYAAYGYDLTIEDFLISGNDEYAFESLTANTKYTVCAFKLNPEDLTAGKITKADFETPEVKASETVKLDFHDAVVDDYRDYDGSFQIIAAPADSSIVVFLNPISDELTGHFTFEDLDTYYSGLIDYEAWEAFDIADCDFTGSANGSKYLYEGWFLCTDTKKYEFSFNCELEQFDFNAPAKKAQKKGVKTLGLKKFNK